MADSCHQQIRKESLCNFFEKNVLVSCVHVPVWKDQRMKKFLDGIEKIIANENFKKKFDGWILLAEISVVFFTCASPINLYTH